MCSSGSGVSRSCAACAASSRRPRRPSSLGAALRAYPAGRAVHLVRDGRDVVCSLLERGWLSTGRSGGDDAGLPYGARARFWVEPERRARVRDRERRDPCRLGVAVLRHGGSVRADPRTLELRYESLVGEPEQAAAAIAEHLGVDAATFSGSLGRAHDRSVGRYRRELTPEQLADVEREAGPLLRELGYGPDSAFSGTS